ncbi:dehydrogenase [Algoriphagus aestuariicola]|uniref:Dehydrogenase n=1 Tax=Algoriphagus aestuariicola TaxID=1852016 RepID=A0ABS3BLQ3_9BACT|nr:PVC-type heme-binding CxxCH protein [Algoriphagus aestuariicola]MBN7800207.1 dehydrogenase [Algoriphagus aestuariicola]
MKPHHLPILIALLFFAFTAKGQDAQADKEFHLKATMLGYFAEDGTRNPTLRAMKGQTVRITITNGETMTHDVAMEKLGVKSETIFDKGMSTSLTFVAVEDDVYYCTIPGHRLAGMVGDFEILEEGETEEVPGGMLPMKDGVPLNFNFEKGSLENWTAEGEAFQDPLIHSDPSPLHGEEGPIFFEGESFLSSGGLKNYQLTGTLVSEPFEVTAPFAAFRVSGGALVDTRVELVLAGTDEVIFKSTGQGRATLQPVVADLTPFLGKEIQIRIIDNETGISQIPYIQDDLWAHINFDDFRFYPSRPNFPNELDQEDIIVLPPLDPVLNAGLSGVEAAKAMTPPPGFKVALAASEPEIIRPISFTIDARNRLWVVEGHTYPVPAPEGEGRDRVLIFEDTDGDGTLDSRKVFAEGLNLVSGIEVGMGGVWLGAAPYLLFIPIDYETDKPAGPAQKLLDGWGTQDTHEVLNNLRWGPDGWLYGTHGVFTHSNVGKPGALDSERTKINAGVWRYHPTRHEFEVFAEGSSNPWGIDFNSYGHSFITVCVIPHLYYVVQGARYQRQAGKHFNPYTFDDIKTIGDHVHWLGDRGPHAGNFRSAAAGGGHAHAGAMIYLGGENWPEEYRNAIFMNNINGARLNIDLLEKSGSGYIGGHHEDFMAMNDSWSQWLNFKYDASGSVFAIDWYDKNQCHSPNPEVHDKSLGRIFKISHENDQIVQANLYDASDLELAHYQTHDNEWYARQSRMILQERGASRKSRKALKAILADDPDITHQLRALWTLHAVEGLDEEEMVELLSNSNEYISSWAIQLLAEEKSVSSQTLAKFAEMAKGDQSAMVRLYLVSAMLRLEPSQRWEVLSALSQRAEDATDHNLPLMLWYALEPMTDLDAARALALAENSKIPILLQYTMDKLGEKNVSAAESGTVHH